VVKIEQTRSRLDRQVCAVRALRLDPTVRDIVPHFMLMIDKVRERAVDSEDEAIAALPAILSYDRRVVRRRFEERFTDAEWPETISALIVSC
jgi:hypothetical protein